MVFAHGSRVESANESVRAVARELAEAGGFSKVEAAFLELGQPDLPGAVGKLVGQGVDEITIIPYFLTLGTHLERDLPRIVDGISRAHNGLEVRVTAPLEGHPALVEALLDRARS